MSPTDPVVLLSLGISFLLRALQSRCENRNYTIATGLTFIQKYRKASGENSQTNYNLARAFHQIGLYHLAIPLYQKVLDANQGFVRESAHNLAFIYVSVGSPKLAQSLYKKYLSFS